jgi:hypothetical protein
MSESFLYDFLISACDEPWKYTFIILHYLETPFLLILIFHIENIQQSMGMSPVVISLQSLN